jgi:alpha-amylase
MNQATWKLSVLTQAELGLVASLAAIQLAGCGGSQANSCAPISETQQVQTAKGGNARETVAKAAAALSAASPRLNPPDTYVNLFKWRWNDIANECTKFLGPQGFGAVQISPPAEHKNVNNWWNIYQPVNHHNLVSDMGNATELQTMINTCHAAGVRIYADVVFNHMATGSGTGVGGSSYNSATLTYPYFSANDFHSYCDITYADALNTANCWLLKMPDLNTASDYVQGQFKTYLNDLVSIGVDGFRIDAAKHILPTELAAVLAGSTATTRLGEPRFVTLEVIENESWIDMNAYLASGTVNEFRFARAVRDAFRNNALGAITNYMGTGSGGGNYGLISDSSKATVFVDNHDTERNPGDSLNYTRDSGGPYDLANIYMLAQPYGRAQLQSGFAFGDKEENSPGSSPYDSNGNPVITTTCTNTSASCGWDFVHRWTTIYPMVNFRSAVSGTSMTVVSTGNGNQLAFRRGNVGFVALNNDSSSAWTGTFATGLPAGTYCNIVHGLLAADRKTCTSDSVTVGSDGSASMTVLSRGASKISAVAIYTGQKVDGPTSTLPYSSNYPTMYLRGTMNNWGNKAPMALVADHTWSVLVPLKVGTAYQYKYETGGGSSWSNNWGQSSGATASTTEGTGSSGGNNIYFRPASTGTYTFLFDDSRLTYWIVGTASSASFVSSYPAMYLRGTMNSWGATAMSKWADHLWRATVSLTSGATYQYKYEISGSTGWSTNWGAPSNSSMSATEGAAAPSGSNILFLPVAAGSYVFQFDEQALTFTIIKP